MEKSRKEYFKWCSDSRVHKMMARKFEYGLSCPICPPNKGCNSYRYAHNNNWKEHRKTQYRNK